uniref:WD_REPEATS_REGION domain-containing protein n=1 Tax=Globodera pallida TaxID=36090 RepID=A0A183C6Q7_GLOPA
MSDQDYEQRERQRELEEKKRKLAEMKAAKLRHKDERFRGKRIENVATRSTMTPAELDAMMADLGIQPRTNREEAPSDPSSTNSTARECNGMLHLEAGDLNLRAKSPKRPKQLELVPVQTVTIHPKSEFISYCKTTQTDEERERNSHGEFSMGSQEFVFDELSIDDEGAGQVDGNFDGSPTMEVRKQLKNLQFHHYSHTTQKDALPEDQGQVHVKIPPLSDEEKRRILSSAGFTRFFQQASRVIERAIAEDSDVFIDYITGSRNDAADDKRELLTLNRKIFAAEQLTTGRAICAIDFSAIHPELVAVCYDRNKDEPLAPDSVINVWNTRFKTASPEMTFTSSSRVMSLAFDLFQSNIIIGACYSGQICIWDTRVNKRMPVCKTPLSSKAHTQPVLCMQMVGTANAHDLVTISTDGRMCSWSIDNLQTPIEVADLTCNRTKKPVSALSMAFLHNSINNFVLGTEENELYIGDRHAACGESNRSIAAHQMPVNSLDMHRAMGDIDFSPLCLTGSMDFSIKLWNVKSQKPTPLLTLERKHKFYVADVQWSPVHPAVFASLSADGILNLWNINVNTENPITAVALGEPGTKFRWSHNGQQIVAGDESGTVHIFDVHESLYNVRPSEWDALKSVLTDLAA